MQRKFYQLLGYAGVLPFVAFLVGFYLNQNNPILGNLFLVMQLSYGAIIISFLAGIHWTDAVRLKSIKRQIFSILPTIFLLPIIFWGFSHSPVQALLMLVGLLWALFVLDRIFFYYRRDDTDTMPRGYILYRFNLTMLVTIILLATYWIAA